MYDIKDIFIDAFDITDITKEKPTMEQLVQIVYNINTTNIETNKKLMEWLVRKYKTKFLEKMSSALALK